METEKLYYADPFLKEFTATVLDCQAGKNGYTVTLDRTAFYPEGGGQPADQPAPIPPSEVPVRTSSVAEGRVRVCTWNVRNYSVAGRKTGGKYVQSPKPEAEKTAAVFTAGAAGDDSCGGASSG